jgi:3-(3-hydroxy-phenyl)propionate hydroxylase
MTHYDAIISGCGPVGATLANLLAAQGLNVCVVEKYREVYDKPRAIAFDWEGMRVLQFCGVAHELSPGTKPHPGTDFRGIDGQIIKVFDPLPPPWDLGWPPTLTFVQPEMERILRAALDRRDNVTVRYGQAVDGFDDRGDQVQVAVTDMDTGAKDILTGDFLIGCDGANSDIRTALGFGLEDYGFDENWLVVDAHQLSETELPNKTTQYCWPSRPATFLIGPGTLRRWELKIMPGETPEEFTNPSRIRQAMTPYVDMDAFEIWRSATYRFNARVGIDWRKGRVILAGDAVHQTPPFLGQGLCAGVRDAINLAWKIVHIQRTGYNDRLLDSYQEERRPHVGTLIQHAKEFGAIIGELDEARARQRDADLSAQLATGQVETKRQGFIPNLETGLIGPPPEGDDAETFAGTLMVQPTILDPSGTEVLLDDHAPMEFLFITDSPEQQQWMDDVADVWTRLGGLRMVIATEAGSKPAQVENGIEYLRDTGDTLARWQDRANASAVLVRPDRYVYATVTDRADLVAKVGRLADVLLPS